MRTSTGRGSTSRSCSVAVAASGGGSGCGPLRRERFDGERFEREAALDARAVDDARAQRFPFAQRRVEPREHDADRVRIGIARREQRERDAAARELFGREPQAGDRRA